MKFFAVCVYSLTKFPQGPDLIGFAVRRASKHVVVGWEEDYFDSSFSELVEARGVCELDAGECWWRVLALRTSKV